MSKVLTRPLRVLIQGKDQLGKARYVNVTESGDLRVQLSGSYVCLSTEEKPEGQQGDTLLEYNEATGETKVYKYISGNWREL